MTLALPESVPGSEGGGVARPVPLVEALPVGDTVAEVEELSVGTLEGAVLGRDARVLLDVAVDEALRDARGAADVVATSVAGAVAVCSGDAVFSPLASAVEEAAALSLRAALVRALGLALLESDGVSEPKAGVSDGECDADVDMEGECDALALAAPAVGVVRAERDALALPVPVGAGEVERLPA